jgi:hypothetical protein
MIHKFCDSIDNNLCKVRPRTKLCHVLSKISPTHNNIKDKILIIMIDIQVVEIRITFSLSLLQVSVEIRITYISIHTINK